MKKLYILTLLAGFLTLACSPIYADGSMGNVTISKTVLNPQTKTYVKNLGIGDAIYHPGDTVIFHITLTNTGSQNVQQLVVKDIFPQYLNFVSGVGSYDQKNKILSFIIYNLKPNTTQSYAVSTQVVPASQFPTNQQQLCLMNKATVLFGQNQLTQDLSQFCIQSLNLTTQSSQPATSSNQPVYPPTKTKTSPSTGPSSFIILSLLFLASVGFILIKKTHNFISIS